MNAAPYSVRWLSPEDAATVAQVEVRVHAPEHRAGTHQRTLSGHYPRYAGLLTRMMRRSP